MKSLKWRGGVALSCKGMKDMPGQGLAGTGTVDIRDRALCLVSVGTVQRDAQKKKKKNQKNTQQNLAP